MFSKDMTNQIGEAQFVLSVLGVLSPKLSNIPKGSGNQIIISSSVLQRALLAAFVVICTHQSTLGPHGGL
jgi:hypothetical protein